MLDEDRTTRTEPMLWPTERAAVERRLSEGRRRGHQGPAYPRSSPETGRESQASIGKGSAQRGQGRRVFHRPVDLPPGGSYVWSYL